MTHGEFQERRDFERYDSPGRVFDDSPEQFSTDFEPVGHCTGEGREMAAAARRQWFAARDFDGMPFPNDSPIIPWWIALALALALVVFWWLT